MKHLIMIIALTTSASAQSRVDRLIASYEAHPSQRTYQAAIREVARVDRRNRQQEQRLKPVEMPRANERFCDGALDERKMRGRR